MQRVILVIAIIVALWRGNIVCAAEGPDTSNVLYLDESRELSLHLKALQRTPIMHSATDASILGFLAPGQPVVVLALGEDQDLISARVATGPVRGWVDVHALEMPPADLVARLRARHEQAEAHREMIARHEVTVGMTRAEVKASLGKPERTARIHTKEGDQEQWFYVVYKYLPYYARDYDVDGNLRQQVSYRREASGHKIIAFKKDEVVEVSDGEPEKSTTPSIKALPPQPVN